MERSAVKEQADGPTPIFMEHRRGQPLPCRALARLVAGHVDSGTGHISNVSSSGAFIETALDLPECTPVTLFVLGNESAVRVVRATAIVVRRQLGGVGVEWCETPAGSICAVLGCTTRCAAIKGQT